MLEIVALTVLVLLAWAVVSVAFLALKGLLWLVILPLRLLVAILVLPLLLLKGVIGGIFFLLFLPLLVLGGLVGAIGFAAAVLVPLMPLLIVAAAVWIAVRVSRSAVSPTTA